jgi:murein L,D-transpeptidase YafK
MRILLSMALLCVACAGKAATTAERVATYGAAVKERLEPACTAQGVAYPPASLTLIGLKAEKRLELWAPDASGRPRLVKTYPILAASGGVGPKLREGDGQVPEGLYGIESLNPNSRFHLSLRVGYPNADDRREGRTRLGGDIMIHGSNVSIGCLAMGDPAAEELFVLAALTGPANIQVILSPVDFRKQATVTIPAGQPDWVPALHAQIKIALDRYR